MLHNHDEASVHGSPGEGARMAGIVRATGPLFIVLFVCGYAAGTMIHWPVLSPQTAGWTCVGIAFLIIVGVFFSRARIEAFFKGAEGEESVARVLARLPAGWHVFHGLNLRGGIAMWRQGDIDHIVVSSSGLFVIETKNWNGRISLANDRLLINGQMPRRDPIAQARQSLETLRLRLAQAGARDLPLIPVVCFASDAFQGRFARVNSVLVCNRENLQETLTNETRDAPKSLDVGQIVMLLGPASTR